MLKIKAMFPNKAKSDQSRGLVADLNNMMKKEKEIYVLHAGIQRSGTNFLRTALKINFSVCLVNEAQNHPRDSILHKHFRLQDDKCSICMDSKYLNSITFGSFAEYKNALKFLNLKAIVIYKDPVNWLESIRRWGYTCKWISSEEDFHSVWRNWLNEYSEYYLKWTQFYEDPNVLLIQYEDFVFNYGLYLNKLEAFLGQKYLSNVFPAKVAHSSLRSYAQVIKGIRTSCFAPELIEKIYLASKFNPQIRLYKN